MKTIFIKYYNPNNIMDVNPETTDEEIKRSCFRVLKYNDEFTALTAYAETPGTEWSTLLEDTIDVVEFIEEAYKHIKGGTEADYEWLERNFV